MTTTTPTGVDGWRGVAAETLEDAKGGLAAFLRARSRRLLGSLHSPHRGTVARLGVVVVLTTAYTRWLVPRPAAYLAHDSAVPVAPWRNTTGSPPSAPGQR